jgi:2-phosphosulfolactate phosphatase
LSRVELHVAFLPEEGEASRRRVLVVVDVLRATTSLVVLIEQGCAEVIVAPTVEAARRFGRAHPGVLTAGEEGGRAPRGFDFGNSPVAFSRAAVAGRQVILATTNGTRAMHLARDGAVTLVGCLRNRSAVAREAAAAAADGHDLTVVCAGREGRFSLDDAYTAGAIVDAILAEPVPGRMFYPTDAARAAQALYRTLPEAEVVFRSTGAGQNVIRIGLEEDVRFCAEPDRSVVVPRVGDRVRLLVGE